MQDDTVYLAQHPEIRSMLDGFVNSILTAKPEVGVGMGDIYDCGRALTIMKADA